MRNRFSILFALAGAACFFYAGNLCAEPRSAVVFASEKIMGQWVKSYFSSIAPGEANFNECEISVSKSFMDGGISVAHAPFEPGQIAEARKFHTVFDRYGDLSGMPNDLIVKAALIVDREAGMAVVCGVDTKGRKEKRGQPERICASAVCEVIDVATKRRVATSADEECLIGARGVAGSVAAVREACKETGEELAEKLGKEYGAE